jgi:hypothetical protein
VLFSGVVLLVSGIVIAVPSLLSVEEATPPSIRHTLNRGRHDLSGFQRPSMSASLTPPTGLGLLASLRGGAFPGRAARGPVAPRKVACRPGRGGSKQQRFKAIDSRWEGRSGHCAFLIGERNGRQDAPGFFLFWSARQWDRGALQRKTDQ